VHNEQKIHTQVRLGLGHERYDNPAVVPLINALCKGALNRLLNHFLPTMKLASKERVGSQVVRKYGATVTPLTRELERPQTRRMMQVALVRLSGHCPWGRTRFMETCWTLNRVLSVGKFLKSFDSGETPCPGR
jgi:hypothetical protein